MEPNSKERILAAAEAAGAERKKKIDTTINRLLGAPEAAGMALTIANETVRAKWEETKGKAIDLRDRTEERFVDTAMDWAERADNAIDRFTKRVTDTKDRAVAKAQELKDRSIKWGLTLGTKVEDKIVAVCEVPANLAEKRAAGLEAKAGQMEADKLADFSRRAAEAAGLTQEQTAALAAFMKAQEQQKRALEAETSASQEAYKAKIEAAKDKASKLSESADDTRQKVEKRRLFKKLLAKVS